MGLVLSGPHSTWLYLGDAPATRDCHGEVGELEKKRPHHHQHIGGQGGWSLSISPCLSWGGTAGVWGTNDDLLAYKHWGPGNWLLSGLANLWTPAAHICILHCIARQLVCVLQKSELRTFGPLTDCRPDPWTLSQGGIPTHQRLVFYYCQPIKTSILTWLKAKKQEDYFCWLLKSYHQIRKNIKYARQL